MVKILLLEPNRLLAQQYITYLTAQGYKVIWRADAQSGILAADENQPDIVVAELLLAGHSGVEFLYEFRSYSDWIRTPVFILSSVTRESSGIPSASFEELGVMGYLYKPETSLDKLGNLIERAVSALKQP